MIPPNATLIFDIEIITAEPPGYNIIKSRELVKKQKKGFLVIDIRTEAERKTTGIKRKKKTSSPLRHSNTLKNLAN